MAAAIAAAEAGVRPTVIDENPLPGGQIYRQSALASHENPSPALNARSDLLTRFRDLEDRIELHSNATAWGLFPPRRLAVSVDGSWTMIEAERLVLATGAYEYVPPFPGWTLPGVMTPGAAQLMAKTMHVIPGKRVLIAGTGPFLLVVALALKRLGADVVGIIEAAGNLSLLRAVPGLLACPGLLCEGAGYLLRLRRAGIPIHRGHIVVEARGDTELREVVVARCDRDWNPVPTTQRTFAVDTLCVGYGFIPRVELALLAGCEMQFVAELGGWIPAVDETFQTSIEGIWVAGDGGGVAGALVAQIEGEIAGVAAAASCGKLSRSEAANRCRRLRRRLSRLRRFRAALDRVSVPRLGVVGLARPDTLVCRCEELSRSEIEASIAAGGTDIRTLKVMTRLGMGACQGRMCWPTVAQLISARTGSTMQQVGPISVRPPIMPMSLADLAGNAVENGQRGMHGS
jgi:NADPH-dependent 2,4-dienoyl-CoA reductase/sulfur reductase-like enzyme